MFRQYLNAKNLILLYFFYIKQFNFDMYNFIKSAKKNSFQQLITKVSRNQEFLYCIQLI